jgi:hypothetical protein
MRWKQMVQDCVWDCTIAVFSEHSVRERPSKGEEDLRFVTQWK